MDIPKSYDEFDAARRLVEVLSPLQPDEQARAVRWAQEKLGVTGPFDVTAGRSRALVPPGGAARSSHELSEALNDPVFLHEHAAVDKMLHLLAIAYRRDPDAFEKVLLLRGRSRRYFARSEQEIEESGNSTQPRNIPGTAYWVMTNSPTGQKRELLQGVLQMLEFSQGAVRDAVATIV